MSKTQEKRAQRLQEAADFIKERRLVQLSVFEAQFKTGVALYEQGKDTLTEEQVVELEAAMEAHKQLIEDYKAKWNL